MKEGWYAVGGTVLGAVTGYMAGKSKSGKVSVPSDIAAEVAKITAFVLPPGMTPLALTIKPLLKFTHFGNVTGIAYLLALNGTGDVDNPCALMKVWIHSDGNVVFDFGHTVGWDVVVYRDRAQLVLLSGKTVEVSVPQGG